MMFNIVSQILGIPKVDTFHSLLHPDPPENDHVRVMLI